MNIAKIARINTVKNAKEFALWADDFAYLCEVCKKPMPFSLYNKIKEAYGFACCCKECKEKYLAIQSEKAGKPEEKPKKAAKKAEEKTEEK